MSPAHAEPSSAPARSAAAFFDVDGTLVRTTIVHYYIFFRRRALPPVLRPLWQRLALGGGVAGLGLAAAGGMWLYIVLYALRIVRSGDRIAITTMTPFGHRDREFAIGELGESAYFHGRVHHTLASGTTGGIWVNAPWITLRAVGHRFAFVIDLQAETIDIGALSVLAEGAVQDWQDDRE